MSKSSGVADYLYVGGVDVSSGIGRINTVGGGPATFDTTALTLDAARRSAAERSGKLHFTAFFDTTLTHPVLSALPQTDVVMTYLRGSTAGLHAAGLLAKQVNYDAHRGTDGSLALDIDAPSTVSDVEWGQTYVGGRLRTDTAPTNGAGVDDGDSTIAGLTAFLHVFAPATITSAVVTIQHSSDNGVTDTWTTVPGGVFTTVTAAPTAERIEVTVTSTIKRWLRVITTGTFSSFPFFVMIARKAGIGLAVDVQVFTASGTWTKPSGATTTLVACVGGGGGGGSGARQASGTPTCGGGGGGAGAFTLVPLVTAALGATEAITVAAGGIGSTGRVLDNVVGLAGNTGGFTRFGNPAKAVAFGGSGGPGGALAATTSAAGGVGTVNGGVGGPGNLGAAGSKPPLLEGEAGGGGSGGGISATPAAFAGGSGGDPPQLALVGEGFGGAIGTDGASGTTTATGQAVGGGGGGGGGSSITGVGGNGGTGGPYGGGAGGGGASLNGSTSGAGGTGGVGILVAVSW